MAHTFGKGSRNEVTARPHQQRVVEMSPQPCQYAAHGRLRHVEAVSRPRNVCLGEEGVERDQGVKIEIAETHRRSIGIFVSMVYLTVRQVPPKGISRPELRLAGDQDVPLW